MLAQRSVALRPVPAPAAPKATVGLRRLSHSEIVSFLTCNRLHYYQYRLRREPRVTATPLLVGRRIENIIKQIWLGQTPDLSELPPEERALCKAYPIWWRHHTVIRDGRRPGAEAGVARIEKEPLAFCVSWNFRISSSP